MADLPLPIEPLRLIYYMRWDLRGSEWETKLHKVFGLPQHPRKMVHFHLLKNWTYANT